MSARSLTLRAGSLTAIALLAGLPFAGVASAAPAADKNCRDFTSQAQAQAVLDADRSDPNGLDRDRDGKACDDFDYGSGGDRAPAVGSPSSTDPGTGNPGTPSDTGSPSGVVPADPTQPDQVVAVPSGSVDAGDGSAQAAGPGAETTATFLLVGFGAVVAAGAGSMVWRTRRAPGGEAPTTTATVPDPARPAADPASHTDRSPATPGTAPRRTATACAVRTGPVVVPAPRVAADDSPVAPRP